MQDDFPLAAQDLLAGVDIVSAHGCDILAIETFDAAGGVGMPVVVTGDSNGGLCVWDKQPDTVAVDDAFPQGPPIALPGAWAVMRVEDPAHGHTRAIRSIVAFRSEIPGHDVIDTYFFTGGDDGRVKIWGHEARPEAYSFVQDLDDDPRPSFTLAGTVDPIVGLRCNTLRHASGDDFDVLVVCHKSGYLQVYDLTPFHHVTVGPQKFNTLRHDTSLALASSEATCMSTVVLSPDHNLLVFMGHANGCVSVHQLEFPYFQGGANPFRLMFSLGTDVSQHRGEITVRQGGKQGRLQQASALPRKSALTLPPPFSLPAARRASLWRNSLLLPLTLWVPLWLGQCM